MTENFFNERLSRLVKTAYEERQRGNDQFFRTLENIHGLLNENGWTFYTSGRKRHVYKKNSKIVKIPRTFPHGIRANKSEIQNISQAESFISEHIPDEYLFDNSGFWIVFEKVDDTYIPTEDEVNQIKRKIEKSRLSVLDVSETNIGKQKEQLIIYDFESNA